MTTSTRSQSRDQVKTKTTGSHRKSYTLMQKLSSLEYIKQKNLKQASRDLSIGITTLKRWRKYEKEMEQLAAKRGIDPASRQKLEYKGRRSSMNPDNEDLLIQYIENERKENWKATTSKAARKARELDESWISVPRQVVRRRLWRIFNRRGIVIRRTTHKAQGCRIEQQTINEFVEYVKEKMDMLDIGHDKICNFDETNLPFSFDSNTTLNKKGERTISYNKSTATQSATLMVGVSGSGYKFPPFVIFRGSNGKNGRIMRDIKKLEAYQDEKKTLFPDSTENPINNSDNSNTSIPLEECKQRCMYLYHQLF